MEHLLKGSISRIIIRRISAKYIKQHGKQQMQVRNYSIGRNFADRKRVLLKYEQLVHKREYGMLVVRALRGILKVRYLILGGAVGGGVTLQKKYQDWKDGLPDMKWLEEVLPDNDRWQQWRGSLITFTDNLKDSIEVDPRLKALSQNKMSELKSWFDQRLDDAIEAAASNGTSPEIDSTFAEISKFLDRLYSDAKADMNQATVVHAALPSFTGSQTDERQRRAAQERIDILQDEMMQTQIKYQRELERVEKENKELRKQNLLLKQGRKPPTRQVKRSLIDMYSDVLDELADYDSGYSTTDQLPRVVVVGDQSSGKTSVLEMIAQARIFPRGAGEMMTRAPVKVTLSEGPYHVAQFRDSSREFDLSKESDLAELRKEVEVRMRNSVRSGATVSTDVISMTVKGPGLQRMVLVDLPGIISTQTTDMAADTRASIRTMSEAYMNNPNAIILCIQDGSVDAERSNVTDIVAQCDPVGKRTIFVLTKVDMAEENHADPQRVRKILAGKLFPMKALGYFAVVTGRGRKDDSIQTIKDYEENFFRNSKLFKDGIIKSTQVTTRNLSLAVADCFWKMVGETVEQQADAFKATRFNLETEWKNNFPRLREQDRDELFDRARTEILDEVVNLSQVSTKQWEDDLLNKIWEKVSGHVFEAIYIPAAQSGSIGTFNTTVDIKLRKWAQSTLPQSSVQTGWETLRSEFNQFMQKAAHHANHDDIFDSLKQAVVGEAMERHAWEDKAADILRVIQLNTLEDRMVGTKTEWDAAIKFLEVSVKERLKQTEVELQELLGPGLRERWMYWRYSSEEQQVSCAVKGELDAILYADNRHAPILSYDELLTIRANLQTRHALTLDNTQIQTVWTSMYRRHFLRAALLRAYDCRKSFYMYQQQQQQPQHHHATGNNGNAYCDATECCDVVMFHRLQQMMRVTANSLRGQIVNREAKRLDKEIKDVLDEYGMDSEKKKELLTGRRVDLAEELKRVRQIQEKLEEFIKALNKEK